MKKVAKIVLIVFVVILEVGYAVDCRDELYEKYKAHSAEFIRLKNKCKPLLEKVVRLAADTYKNTVEYQEYEAIEGIWGNVEREWLESSEYIEMKKKQTQCVLSPESKAYLKRIKELKDINAKTQAYKAYKQALKETHIEINATCSLFSSGVYDVDKAFERIAKAEHKTTKARKAWENTPQHQAVIQMYSKSPYSFDCNSIITLAREKYFAAYNKVSETAKKAFEPLETAFRNSPEFKEYKAACGGIISSEGYSNWGEYQEYEIISYIKSTIANRP